MEEKKTLEWYYPIKTKTGEWWAIIYKRLGIGGEGVIHDEIVLGRGTAKTKTVLRKWLNKKWGLTLIRTTDKNGKRERILLVWIWKIPQKQDGSIFKND